ncbi:MAG: hypothetical protein OXQ29_14540 [Rhodospirillaceae bacterium]|nr:hypothetical protein [Rhodospirillaceae bacterium]
MQSTESRTDWLPLDGNWKFDGDNATFEHDPAESTQSRHPLGVALSALRAPRGGSLSADVTLPDNLEGDPAARLLVGFEAASKDYYTVGLGGYGAAYVLHECRGDVHRQLHGLGRRSHLRPGGKYHVAAAVHSHRVTLAIDGISVFTQDLPRPLTAQAGVFAHAYGTVRFEAFDWVPSRGTAFVVMEFDELYNSLYKSVIKPICEDGGFDAERADDVYRPGVILQDITAALGAADVVIAGMSPVNANVFYEVGYAHARQTPTILLARRGERLPFDVSGYRTIFYENSISGKDDVAADLRRHLAHIR